MAKSREIPAGYLRECLSYDKTRGTLRWKHRPIRHFASRGMAEYWNRRYAGRLAGSVQVTSAGPYIRVRINPGRCRLHAHTIIWALMTGSYPPIGLDHKNGDGLDNRWKNLRLASVSQNGANRRVGSNNTSGCKGVHWSIRANKWQVRLAVQKRRIHVGYFDKKVEAIAAYNAAARKHFGQFAK